MHYQWVFVKNQFWSGTRKSATGSEAEAGGSDFVVSFVEKTSACFLLTGHFYPSSSPPLIIDLNVSSPSSSPKIHRSQQDLAPLTSTPPRASSPPPIIDPNILRSTFLSFFQPVLPTFLSNVYFSKYENVGCIYCAYREVLLLVWPDCFLSHLTAGYRRHIYLEGGDRLDSVPEVGEGEGHKMIPPNPLKLSTQRLRNFTPHNFAHSTRRGAWIVYWAGEGLNG